MGVFCALFWVFFSFQFWERNKNNAYTCTCIKSWKIDPTPIAVFICVQVFLMSVGVSLVLGIS